MKWLKVSQFWRGVGAALGLLAASPAVLEVYSPLDLVAAVHAVIVAWAQVAEGIVNLLHRLGLPKFPPEVATSVMLGLAIGPAWSLSVLKSEWGQHQGVVQNTAFGVRAGVAFGEALLWSLFVVAAPVGSLLFWGALIPLVLLFGTALASLPAYRRGFLFALGALAALEGVYLLSTETVQAAFDGFVCQHETAGAPRCAPDAGP